jgi:hypothetical protein
MVFPPLFLWRLRMRVGLSNWSTRREKILTVSYAVLVFLAAIGGTIGAVSSIMKFTSS